MPSTMNTALFGLLVTAAKVAAHGFVDGFKIDNVPYTGYLVTTYSYESNPPKTIAWSETATDLGFVSPSAYAKGDIICHMGAKNGALHAPVKGGGTVESHWNTWPMSHRGPIINMMANCGGDCSTVDKATLKWFKISESGLLDNSAAPGKWASDVMMANNLSSSVTIPASIAPGKYVLRHEIISLHSAANADGAQNYPFCVNLEVSGSGTDVPAGVLGTALYKATDPGIMYDIYQSGKTYPIPGPALYAGGSGSGAGTSSGTGSSTGSGTGSSGAAPATTPAPAPANAPASGSVPTTMATAVKPPPTDAPAPVPNTQAAADEEDDDACGQ